MDFLNKKNGDFKYTYSCLKIPSKFAGYETLERIKVYLTMHVPQQNLQAQEIIEGKTEDGWVLRVYREKALF